MNGKSVAILIGLTCLWPLQARGDAQSQQAPVVQIPNPGVPQIITMEGKFVRAAYNNEGYVILGYQVANRSIGEEWMLLEVGMTVLDKTPDYTLTRDALSLETPDGKTHSAAVGHRAARGEHPGAPEPGERPARLDQLLSAERDPARAASASSPTSTPARMPYDQVELDARARLPRPALLQRFPGGIKYGQHWLNVKFEKSLVRVPFRILTEEEEKTLSKNYKAISKQVEDAFKPKKK